jgi:hypothetical protein
MNNFVGKKEMKGRKMKSPFRELITISSNFPNALVWVKQHFLKKRAQNRSGIPSMGQDQPSIPQPCFRQVKRKMQALEFQEKRKRAG